MIITEKSGYGPKSKITGQPTDLTVVYPRVTDPLHKQSKSPNTAAKEAGC